ncbi:hypothetical protein CDD83_9649 [Cordyceps sp. RAO-2017]|nr:hypothetical protein CDD83_9649 [Cordyceps sp. RAO-2017]
MCTYARTIFECKHDAWGRRLKLCSLAEDYGAGSGPGDCAARKPHGLHSRRVPRQCDKCRELDRKRSLLRAKLDECREMLRRRWPAYWAGDGLRRGPETTAAEPLGRGSLGGRNRDGNGGGAKVKVRAEQEDEGISLETTTTSTTTTTTTSTEMMPVVTS